MTIQIPEAAHPYGFITTPGGTHTSRTIMLSELQILLATCPASAQFADYEAAILDENILLKSTASTRRRTLRGLRELYALDPSVLLFRTLRDLALRDLWESAAGAQPLLALLTPDLIQHLPRLTTPHAHTAH